MLHTHGAASHVKMPAGPRPAFAANNIPVVLSADENYASFLSVCLQSMLEHVSPAHNYDLLVLETKILPHSKALLQEMTAPFANVSLRFINPTPWMNGVHFPEHKSYPPETYYRLLLEQIFAAYEKVIYLDCDTVVLADLALLFNSTDVSNCLLAATPNANAVPTYVLNYYMNYIMGWKDYLDKILRLRNPLDYFQAGLMVINIDAFKRHGVLRRCLAILDRLNPILVDQDVLNCVCEGQVRLLSQQWDLMPIFHTTENMRDLFQYLPPPLQKDYQQAMENPCIVHFAGDLLRPWLQPRAPFAERWWKYARQTLFYERILYYAAHQRARAAQKEYA